MKIFYFLLLLSNQADYFGNNFKKNEDEVEYSFKDFKEEYDHNFHSCLYIAAGFGCLSVMLARDTKKNPMNNHQNQTRSFGQQDPSHPFFVDKITYDFLLGVAFFYAAFFFFLSGKYIYKTLYPYIKKRLYRKSK